MRRRIGVEFDATGRPVRAVLSDNVPQPVEGYSRSGVSGSLVIGRSGMHEPRPWAQLKAAQRARERGEAAA